MEESTASARGSEPRKMLVALAVFAAIVSCWIAFRQVSFAREQARVAASPLPTTGPDAERGCTLWFIGSSSMHNWQTLAQDMAPWTARNRGIAGATMDEITHRFGNEPKGEAPQAIVYYAGENDIAFGGTADQAFAGLESFIAAKRKRMGAVPMFVLSLKPSPTRWSDRPAQIAYNRAAERLADRSDDLTFVDIVPRLLVNGQPGPFYIEDGIHMNPAGYVRWAEAVGEALPNELPDDLVKRCSHPGTTGGA